MAQLCFEGVSRVFSGGVRAVDGIDLTVDEGEFFVLVGPSGCGKTTTLRLIAGLERPTSGHISIGGRVANDVPCRDRDVAMVFQNATLYPHLTVYENVAFGLKLRHGIGGLRHMWRRMTNPDYAREMSDERRAIPTRARQAAAALGIEHLLDRRASEISGGERERVAIAKATMRRAAVTLFDEPLSNLDAHARVELRRDIRSRHRELGGTTVYVTHDQAEAVSLADRIAVMASGRVEQIGTPQQIYDEPANTFVAGFIGTPRMNLVAGVVRRTGEGTAPLSFQTDDWQVAVPPQAAVKLTGFVERPMILGLRPEDVHLQPAPDASSGLISATVAAIEPQGSTTLVLVNTSESTSRGQRFSCLSDERTPFVVGDAVQLGLNLRRACWFDATTGRNIECSLQQPTRERPAA